MRNEPPKQKVVGPYQSAVRVGNLLFCSGQIPIHPTTMQIEGLSTAEQSHQVLKNCQALLEYYNLTLQDVRKTSCFLTRMQDFASFNAVYELYFFPPYPARSCVEVSKLPKDVLVEIELIAECRN